MLMLSMLLSFTSSTTVHAASETSKVNESNSSNLFIQFINDCFDNKDIMHVTYLDEDITEAFIKDYEPYYKNKDYEIIQNVFKDPQYKIVKIEEVPTTRAFLQKAKKYTYYEIASEASSKTTKEWLMSFTCSFSYNANTGKVSNVGTSSLSIQVATWDNSFLHIWKMYQLLIKLQLIKPL